MLTPYETRLEILIMKKNKTHQKEKSQESLLILISSAIQLVDLSAKVKEPACGLAAQKKYLNGIKESIRWAVKEYNKGDNNKIKKIEYEDGTTQIF
jgi:hypothetical protein